MHRVTVQYPNSGVEPIEQWVTKHIKNKADYFFVYPGSISSLSWVISHVVYEFQSPADAVLFKLRFGSTEPPPTNLIDTLRNSII